MSTVTTGGSNGNGNGAGPHYRVAVIGGGLGGVGLGVRLLEAGIDDFVICERNDSVGGTWFEHTYPGCACDIPTHLYSYSFARNPNWSRLFPRQEEILAYVRGVADEHGVTPQIRFGTEMESCAWDEDAACWRLSTSTGPLSADFLVSAVGAFTEPVDPDLPGLDQFEGHRFHSARWDHGHDLRGERVAVIGTGPSAAQFVPRIVREVSQLTVYQRTAPWVVPHPDRPVPGIERLLYRALPPIQDAQRNLIFSIYEAAGVGFRGQNALVSATEALCRAHLRRQVPDLELRAKLTPNYRFGCKRPLLSNHWYPALMRENADVVTDGLDRVEGREIVTRTGERREFDTIISASGYAYARSSAVERISGVDGSSLGALWDGSPRAYLGTTVPNFPNFFILLGPNSVAINSVIFSLEAQIAYVMDALKTMDRTGAERLEVKPAEFESFIAEMDERSAGSVWTDGGCNAYYTDDEGRNFAIYPGFAAGYRRRTRRFDPAAYQLERAAIAA